MSNPNVTLSDRQEALIAKANAWNHARKVRAVNELTNYRLLPQGALLNRTTGEIYHPLRVIERATGPQFIGCDCPDWKKNVAPLREAMGREGAGAPISCKHSSLRTLLSGQSIRINSSVFTAKPAVLK